MTQDLPRTSRRVVAEAGALGLLLGLLVVAPWVGSGYLLLLDWVSGPEQALTPGVYGLSGSALDAMPFRLATQALREVIGPAATAWFLILAFFPIASAGAAAATGGDRWRAWPAALLMVCNPFVVDRVRAGHVAVLLGMAVLPWLFAAAVHARRMRKPFAVRPALYYALAISMSPHMAWIGGVLLLAVAVLPRPTRTDLVRTLQVVVTASLVYGYALVLYATGTRTLQVTQADLDAYATAPGPGGLLPTVLSLHGFWREFDDTVRSGIGGIAGALLLLAVIGLVLLGFATRVRTEADRMLPLAAVTVAGLLLGAGVTGPVGGLYRLMFDVLPLFEAMREQQKWLALAVLGYAVGFGHGIGWLADRAGARLGGRRRAARGAVVLVGAVPLAIAPLLVWGLGGTVRTSQYPADWQAAADEMGPGDGVLLFLPWHAYQPFDFTDGRTVATPAPAFFARPTLVSDAVELPGLRTDSTSLRTAYVDRIISEAGAGALGPLLAPLGVEYIAVARTPTDEPYGWVADQPDVTTVLTTDDLVLYRVARDATGRVGPVAREADFDEAAEGYRDLGWGTEAVLPSGGRTTGGDLPSDSSGGIRRESPTRWAVEEGQAGWLVIPEEWSDGWASASGETAVPTLAGTVALRVGAEATAVEYLPWRLLGPAVAGSLAVLLVLVLGGVLEHRREIRSLL